MARSSNRSLTARIRFGGSELVTNNSAVEAELAGLRRQLAACSAELKQRTIERDQALADQAVIVIENSRLLTELDERTRDLQEALEYQTAIGDLLKVISRSTFDLQPVLDLVVQTAARLCDAPMAALAVKQGEHYRYVATVALTAEFDAAVRSKVLVPGRHSIVPRTVLERQVVQIPDVAADPEYE